MAVLFNYFSAPTDEVAASVIDHGPAPDAAAEELPAFDTVALSGIDPVVQMGTLESILTGTPYAQVRSGPRAADVLAQRDEGELLVVTMTATLRAALSKLEGDRMPSVAAQWGDTEEFQVAAYSWSPDELQSALGQLAGLAQRASATEQHLYCWVCV